MISSRYFARCCVIALGAYITTGCSGGGSGGDEAVAEELGTGAQSIPEQATPIDQEPAQEVEQVDTEEEISIDEETGANVPVIEVVDATDIFGAPINTTSTAPLEFITPTLTPSPDGIGSMISTTNYGHLIFNGGVTYSRNPHPQSFHLYEYAPVDLPPEVSRERLTTLAREFASEFELFDEEILRQMNSIYSDVSAGISTSDDEIIQGVDFDFVQDIERCITERTPGGEIVSYSNCLSVFFAYRVASGGVLITQVRTNTPTTSQFNATANTPVRFEIGVSHQGFSGHQPPFDLSNGVERDNGEYVRINTLVSSGFDGGGGAFLVDGGPIVDQAERNKTALIIEAGINNLIGIRTGEFAF